MDWVRAKIKHNVLVENYLLFLFFSKPVSYYLHIIDRTKLENYFQGLKTKGNTVNGDGEIRNTLNESNSHVTFEIDLRTSQNF